MVYNVIRLLGFIFIFSSVSGVSAQEEKSICLLNIRAMEAAVQIANDVGRRSPRDRAPLVREILYKVGGEIGPQVPVFKLARSGIVADSSSPALATKRGLAVVSALGQIATRDLSIRVDGLGVARDREDIDRDGDRREAVYGLDTWIRIIQPENTGSEHFSSSVFRLNSRGRSSLDRRLGDIQLALDLATDVSNVRARLVVDRRTSSAAEVRIEVEVRYPNREIFNRGLSKTEEQIVKISESSMREAMQTAYRAGQNNRHIDMQSVLSDRYVGAIITPRVPTFLLPTAAVGADSTSRSLAIQRGAAVVAALMGQAPTSEYSLYVDGKGTSQDRSDSDRDGNRREEVYEFDTEFRVLKHTNQASDKFRSSPFRISGKDLSVLRRNIEDLENSLVQLSRGQDFRARLRTSRISRHQRPSVEAHIEFEVRYTGRKVFGPGLQIEDLRQDDW